MNQGKLEMVKQEMARVNNDILGISELKWSGVDEFYSDSHNSFKRTYASVPVAPRTVVFIAPDPCRPLLTHTCVQDFWTLMGKSGSVSCGVTAPFSWVLVHTRFPPRG